MSRPTQRCLPTPSGARSRAARRRVAVAAAGPLLALSAASCSEAAPELATATKSPSGTISPKDAAPKEISAADFDLAAFDRSTTIDNQWFPLQPGTQYSYEGGAVDEGQRLRRAVIFTVTDLTKVIDGVRTVVAWERDFTEGELVEAELVMFAQDNDGNVWLLGEYPEEYEDGKFVAAPTWIHGVAGATAGVTIRAKPRLGAPDYAQGFAPPPVNWADRARVYRTGQRICVPAGCYSDVLVTEEFEKAVPDAFQLKFYAAGVGTVRVGWRGSKEDEKEVLVMTRRRQLGPDAMAEVRAQALKLESHAYRISKDVYAHTPRSEPAP